MKVYLVSVYSREEDGLRRCLIAAGHSITSPDGFQYGEILAELKEADAIALELHLCRSDYALLDIIKSRAMLVVGLALGMQKPVVVWGPGIVDAAEWEGSGAHVVTDPDPDSVVKMIEEVASTERPKTKELAWLVTPDALVRGEFPTRADHPHIGAFLFSGGFVQLKKGRVPAEGIIEIVKSAGVIGVVGTAWDAILDTLRRYLDDAVGTQVEREQTERALAGPAPEPEALQAAH